MSSKVTINGFVAVVSIPKKRARIPFVDKQGMCMLTKCTMNNGIKRIVFMVMERFHEIENPFRMMMRCTHAEQFAFFAKEFLYGNAEWSWIPQEITPIASNHGKI